MFHSQVSGENSCSCFSLIIALRTGQKTQYSICPNISICSQKCTFISVTEVRHSVSWCCFCIFCKVCGFSVKSDLPFARGSLHPRYLQWYKDQTSCLGEPGKAAICLARRDRLVGVKALPRNKPSLPSVMGRSGRRNLQVSVHDARPRWVSPNSPRPQVLHNCTHHAKTWGAVTVKGLLEVVP